MSSHCFYTALNTTTSVDGYATDLITYPFYSISYDSFDLDDLYMLVNEMITDFTGHFNLTADTHSGVDDYAYGIASTQVPVISYGEAYGVLRALWVAAKQHAANDVVHENIDSTNFSGLPVDFPEQINVPAVIAFANELKASFNNHISDGVVHSAPDAANVIGISNAVDDAFRWTVGYVSVTVTALDQFNIDAKVFECKFGVIMGNSGDLSFIASPSHLEVIVDKSTPGASTWDVDVLISGRNLQVWVTGETGKTIEWSCKMGMEANLLF